MMKAIVWFGNPVLQNTALGWYTHDLPERITFVFVVLRNLHKLRSVTEKTCRENYGKLQSEKLLCFGCYTFFLRECFNLSN